LFAKDCELLPPSIIHSIIEQSMRARDNLLMRTLNAVKPMMYGFGDAETPYQATVDLLEVEELACQLMPVAYLLRCTLLVLF
jgi:hypothetical protein